WSGKEHKELRCNFLATIARHPKIPCKALCETWAEMDFIYLWSHIDSTLKQLKKYNHAFHQYKVIFT
ncbi:hypothetical protein M422DRAFT_163028, partial [Sphaerobolus stellatus SS14]